MSVKDRVRAQFGATAAGYVTGNVFTKGEDLPLMVEWARPQADERALDIATGGGHTALAFAAHVQEVVATDLTPEMLAAAEAHITANGATNVRFELADAEALPFDDSSFELVTCRIAPHHFPDPQRFVREVARLLRPTDERPARFLLSDLIVPEDDELDAFMNTLEVTRDPSHVRSHRSSEWVRWCAEAGLEVVALRRFQRPMIFQPWVERAKVPEERRAELLRQCREASPHVQRYVTWEGERLHSINSDLVVLCAERLR